MENQTTNLNLDASHQVKPNNNLPLAIVSTILGCCSFCGLGFIVGIVAIIFSTQVNKKFDMGDYLGAEKSAKNVKLLSYIALALFIIGIIVNIYMWQSGKYDDVINEMQKGFNEGMNNK